jgi:electron transfer flavoprotein alpha subunit
VKSGVGDIWVLVQHQKGTVEGSAFGLIAEARRLLQEMDNQGRITAVALGSGMEEALKPLGAFGADRVLYIMHESFGRYQGELFSLVLSEWIAQDDPFCLLTVQGPETADLCPRLAALMETALVTHAVDLRMDEEGRWVVTRPVSNGFLFEKILIQTRNCPIISFLPSVLNEPEPEDSGKAEVLTVTPDPATYDLETKVTAVRKASPGDLGIEEADIVVAGGRGVGKGSTFDIIHALARAISGSVGGTRPVIDWQVLPFERQIGQTGKTLEPRLMLACGISGANEFTAGMEKSRWVIAINTDPQARIFRFADLGVVGDVHEIVPLLIEEIKKVTEL